MEAPIPIVGGAASPPTFDLPHQLVEVSIGFGLQKCLFLVAQRLVADHLTCRKNPLKPEILDKRTHSFILYRVSDTPSNQLHFAPLSSLEKLHPWHVQLIVEHQAVSGSY